MTAHLPDINFWIAHSLPGHPGHAAAKAWSSGLSHPPGSLLFCRATQQGFLRLITNPRVMAGAGLTPLGNQSAFAYWESLLANPVLGFASEPPGIGTVWKQLAAVTTPRTDLWMDAWLAAFAIAGGLRFVTFDAGFRSFRPRLDLVLLTS